VVSVIATILFLVATILIIWYIIEYETQRGWLIGTAVSDCTSP
jgi:hypothetical protein